MASTLRFIFQNLADSAAISASPAYLSTKWVTNLQQQGRETGRTTGLASQDVNLVWPTVQTINAIGHTGHNRTAAGTTRGRLYDDAALSSLIAGADTGAVTSFDTTGLDPLDIAALEQDDADFRGYKNTMLYLNDDYDTVRAAKLTFADAANPAGWMEDRHVWAGQYREARYAPPMGGQSVKLSSKTVLGDLEGGGSWSDRKPGFRIFNLNMAWIDEADRAAIMAGFRYVGTFREFFLAAAHDIGGTAEVYYQGVVKCITEVDFNESNVNLISAQLQLKEQ